MCAYCAASTRNPFEKTGQFSIDMACRCYILLQDREVRLGPLGSGSINPLAQSFELVTAMKTFNKYLASGLFLFMLHSFATPDASGFFWRWKKCGHHHHPGCCDRGCFGCCDHCHHHHEEAIEKAPCKETPKAAPAAAPACAPLCLAYAPVVAYVPVMQIPVVQCVPMMPCMPYCCAPQAYAAPAPYYPPAYAAQPPYYPPPYAPPAYPPAPAPYPPPGYGQPPLAYTPPPPPPSNNSFYGNVQPTNYYQSYPYGYR